MAGTESMGENCARQDILDGVGGVAFVPEFEEQLRTHPRLIARQRLRSVEMVFEIRPITSGGFVGRWGSVGLDVWQIDRLEKLGDREIAVRRIHVTVPSSQLPCFDLILLLFGEDEDREIVFFLWSQSSLSMSFVDC
jgi:hypothetical protein